MICFRVFFKEASKLLLTIKFIEGLHLSSSTPHLGLELGIPSISRTYSLIEFTTIKPGLFFPSYSHLFHSDHMVQVIITSIRDRKFKVIIEEPVNPIHQLHFSYQLSLVKIHQFTNFF